MQFVRAGISVRVRDGVRIINRVRRRVKLVNYSLITALPTATSAYPLFTSGPPSCVTQLLITRQSEASISSGKKEASSSCLLVQIG